MENENRKGPGVFYAVVGVATLVVAIIGATFAFFSASTGQQGAGVLEGQTQNINNATLHLSVDRVHFTNASVPSDDLVPAFFGVTSNTLNVANPSALTSTQVSSMLSNKCVNSGFTGCHVYRITISADEDITYANLLLNLELDNLSAAEDLVDKTQWGYVVFKGTETMNATTATNTDSLTATTINAASHGAPASFYTYANNTYTATANDLDIHNGSLTANTSVVYYLLVYVNDTNVSQNTVVNEAGDANYVVGQYAGTLELQALGGKVRASFGA